MKEQLIAFAEENQLWEKGDGIVLGVSGGADSMCLLQLLYEMKSEYDLKLYVVHVNHGIRGEEAKRDASFVETFAKEKNLPFFMVEKNVPAYARENKLTEEEAGRVLRYEVLEKIRREKNAASIAVAHHKDDQAETVLFQLFRGTGVRGLAGMLPKKDGIIRPLLFAERRDIENYLQQKNITYCQDSTNEEMEYSRNRLRHDILPLIERELNGKARSHIADSAKKVAQWRQYMEKQGEIFYEKIVTKGEEFLVDIPTFQKLDVVIQDEVLRKIFLHWIPAAKDIGQVHYDKVKELVRGENGKRITLPQGLIVVKRYNELAFTKETGRKEKNRISVTCEIPSTHIVENDEEVYKISLELWNRVDLPAKIPEKDYTKWFDYDMIKSGLVLRNPQPEDYFSMGNGKTKKLNRYFIDKKVPREERASCLVLAENNHILWIMPKRVSEAYKITEKTKRVLVVTKERKQS